MEFTNVICSTPDEFHAEVEKWQKKGASPITRGRKLYAYGEVVAELVTMRGGFREGSGRPKVEGGVRRMWTVPPDVDAAIQERGTKWLWELVRTRLSFE